MLSVMRITTLILMFGIGRYHLHWTVISPRVLPIFSPTGFFLPKTGFLSNSLLCLGFRDFQPSRAEKMLIFQGFANSRIVREFPPFSFKVRIATLTRNQVVAQAARGFESHPVRHKSTVILIELRWIFSMPENRLK